MQFIDQTVRTPMVALKQPPKQTVSWSWVKRKCQLRQINNCWRQTGIIAAELSSVESTASAVSGSGPTGASVGDARPLQSADPWIRQPVWASRPSAQLISTAVNEPREVHCYRLSASNQQADDWQRCGRQWPTRETVVRKKKQRRTISQMMKAVSQCVSQCRHQM